MRIDFKHKHAAHCETGVTANMLNFYGVELSEPMVLGIGAGAFFSYMPFIKLNGSPVISFRPLPGQIFGRVTKRLGFEVKSARFLCQDNAMRKMDALLEKGIPVGNIVGVYHLPYFPKEYRFHFNAHNICVIGKENDTYTVSDPCSTSLNELAYDDLKRVRFAKGTYPPYGNMYWVSKAPDVKPDIRMAALHGIALCGRRMLDIPLPYFGIKGIRMLAQSMRLWEAKLGERKAALRLAQLIRMLEEIGTGGAGFRYMYAAFLQEASPLLDSYLLEVIGKEMTVCGDLWREFAFEAARKFKERGSDVCTYDQLADKLVNIARKEQRLFEDLRDIFWYVNL